MEIIGSDLIDRIQSMVQVDTRAKHKELIESLAAVARPWLAEKDVSDRAESLFDLFRKCRRDSASSKDEGEGKKSTYAEGIGERLWAESNQGWGHLSIPDMTALWTVFQPDFDTLLTEFNSTRSRATHVLAVLRPFKEKYLNEWALIIDNYPAEHLRKKAEELRIARVHDKVELAVWSTRVYELFSRAAVNNPKWESKVHSLGTFQTIKKVPIGMISSTSERIYSQQWRLWIRENEDRLLVNLRAAPEPLLVNSFETSIRQMEENTQLIDEVIVRPSSLNSTNNSIEVTLSPESDETLKATRSWATKKIALSEVGDWIKLVVALWDVEYEALRMHVRILNDSGIGDYSLKARSLEDAPLKIEQLLQAV